MFAKTFSAALIGLALSATPALADNAVQRTEVRVAYGDLDLTTIEGQQRLDQRLHSAARQACGFNGTDSRNLSANARAQACYKQARGKARQAMAVAVENAADSRLGG